MKTISLISGTSNKPLAQKVAKLLKLKLIKTEIQRFPNNELRIRVLEKLKNKNVFILQTLNGNVDDYIIELGLLADASHRLGAKKITAIIPFLGYSPQDKIFREGESLSSQVVIKMLEASDIDEFVVFDIHSELVLKMFTKKVHHLSAMPVFIDYFKNKIKNNSCSVALDKGALDRATEFSKKLNLPLVKFDKFRDRKTGEVTFKKLSGDVEGKEVISFDDFVSTGGTRINGSRILKEQGAKKYYDCVTHLIVPETTKKFEKSNIDKIFITDSISLEKKYKVKKLNIISIAPIIAKFILSKE